MRRWMALAIVFLAGCAQIFGIERTTGLDAAVDGTPIDAKYFDAKPCSGGDAAMLDETFGHCYVHFTTPLDYLSARAACMTEAGFHLARIETSNEQPLIATVIGTTAVAWIGGNDISAEGTFVWDTGTPIQLTNWNTSQPSSGGGLFDEDCIAVDGAAGGRWDDRACDAMVTTSDPGVHGYVCERD
jgi:hypothetical protein